MFSRYILLGLFIFSCGPVSADNLQMIISGKAFHIGSNEDLNENNYGYGLQYDFEAGNRWVPVINMASLKDSNNNTSRYIGGGIKRRFRLFSASQRMNFDAGVIGLVMTRPGYNNDEPFFGATPFVALSNDWGGINLTYVPRKKGITYAFWYMQFSVKLLEM